MYQLFSILIKNGIKFDKNVPIIKIRCSEIKGIKIPDKIKSKPKATYKKIQFVDNGIGIAEKQIKKICKPFRRLPSKGTYFGNGHRPVTLQGYCRNTLRFYRCQ